VLASLSARQRGIGGGLIFTGVGLGIAASGTLVPVLIRWDLVATWCGLGAIALLLTAIAWAGWPAGSPAAPEAAAVSRRPGNSTAPLRALYVEYALNAVGLVPHMVFLVDFVARGLGRGLEAGGFYWVVFGAGAVVGPLLAGYVGGRIGFRAALRGAFVIQAAAIAAPLWVNPGPALLLSSLIVGAFVPGIVAITVGRTGELTRSDPEAGTAVWGRCTSAFAIGQAVAAYAFSYIFAETNHPYPILFAVAVAALLMALGIDLAINRTTPRRQPGDGCVDTPRRAV
jgi:predicted MFS family arabinose efflux permease